MFMYFTAFYFAVREHVAKNAPDADNWTVLYDLLLGTIILRMHISTKT